MKQFFNSTSRPFSAYVLFIMLLLNVIACNKGKPDIESPGITRNLNAITDVEFPDSVALERCLYIVNLGLIDVLSNNDVRTELYNKTKQKEYDDQYLISELKDALSNKIDLAEAMKESVLNNAGTEEMADSIELILEGLEFSNTTFNPLIDVLLSDETITTASPLLGTGWINATKSTLAVTDYFDNARLIIMDENSFELAMERPIWVVNFRITIGGEEFAPWLPWRRCYCTRNSKIIRPDGSEGTSSQGTCSASGNEEHCAKCGRGDFHGTCPGNPCSGC